MTTRALVSLSAAIEAATGVALIAVPDFVARVLLGAELSASGVAVARVAGFALLSLGLACWPTADGTALSATRALFAYNLLAALYLGYLRVSGEFAAFLLWPAVLFMPCWRFCSRVQPMKEFRRRRRLEQTSSSPRKIALLAR